MSKQTAVEWFIDKLNDLEFDLRLIPNHIEKAKAMEKEQLLDMGNQFAIIGEDSPEQYYNKTFVSKGSDELEQVVNDYDDDPTWIDDEVELPQQEISDEEIIKLANEHILYNDSKRQWVIEGMKLYKKQLKNK